MSPPTCPLWAQQTLWERRQNVCKSQRGRKKLRKQGLQSEHDQSSYEITESEEKHAENLKRSTWGSLYKYYVLQFSVFMGFQIIQWSGLWFLCLSLGSFPSVGLYCVNLMLQFFLYFTILYVNINLSTTVKDNHGSVHYTWWANKNLALSMEWH